MTASIPTPRKYIHARRLVNAGFKVGIVAQTETRALKAASANKNQPFSRALTEVFTRSTFMPSEDDDSEIGSYILAMIEEPAGGGSGSGNHDARVRVSMLAVHVQTGDIVYDSFEDDFLRRELDLRLKLLQPCEIVLPNKSFYDTGDDTMSTTTTSERLRRLPVSQLSAKVLEAFAGAAELDCVADIATRLARSTEALAKGGGGSSSSEGANVHEGNHTVRFEYVSDFEHVSSLVVVSGFFGQDEDGSDSTTTASSPAGADESSINTVLATVLELPRMVITCVGTRSCSCSCSHAGASLTRTHCRRDDLVPTPVQARVGTAAGRELPPIHCHSLASGALAVSAIGDGDPRVKPRHQARLAAVRVRHNQRQPLSVTHSGLWQWSD